MQSLWSHVSEAPKSPSKPAALLGFAASWSSGTQSRVLLVDYLPEQEGGLINTTAPMHCAFTTVANKLHLAAG